MVICLSHPGDQYKEGNKVIDEILAKQTRDVDVIIGGHTYKYFYNPIINKNKKGDDSIVNQFDQARIVLGRRGFEFTKFSGKKLANSHTISVSEKTEG